MSLYLKYRPQNFNTIVGQQHVVKTLTNAIKQDLLTHAYLFCGPRGTGKTSTARIIAKSLNCLNRQDGINPCDECENCKSILHHQMVDLIEIDAASNRGIDEIRELREKIQFSPSQGKVKVYIIDEVHMLTKEAFNALLKTLEEPPTHAYFILATTEAHKIPETIISRCQQFTFKRITEENIAERLKEISNQENIESDEEGLKLIAKLSEGGLRDAIGLFEQIGTEGKVNYQHITESLGVTGHMTNEQFFESIQNKNIQAGLEVISEVNEKGASMMEFCKSFIYYLREKMLLSVKNNQPTEQIIECIELFSKAKNQVNQALIPQMPIEIALIKACGYQSSKTRENANKLKVDESKEKEAPKKEVNPVAPELKTESKDKKINLSEAMSAPQKTEEKTTNTITTVEPIEKEVKNNIEISNITTEAISQKWKEITNAIETPFIKMSFMSAELKGYENNIIHLNFKSQTLMEKIEEAKGKSEVINAFERVLKINPELKLEVEQITVNIDTQITTAKKNEPSNSMEKVANMAEEVFGE